MQREKQRLEREKSKYVEREHRLEKIRNAMGMQEITVKTSKGEEFKFGGISEKFTQKLFEWEERRNIAPESSTIGKYINIIHHLFWITHPTRLLGALSKKEIIY